MLDSFGNVPNRQLYKIDDELYELIIVHNGLYVSRIMVSISDILFLTMILDLVQNQTYYVIHITHVHIHNSTIDRR